jgi:hypothetical protein
MHSSPVTRQRSATSRGGLAHRPTFSGPTSHLPEQQVASEAHRSCSGWQPDARTQRLGPSADGAQRPEQQSLSSMHSAAAGLQPGSAWQRMAGPGIAVHRPLQQTSPVTQISPSTRHAASSRQRATPLSP